jgi:hypothetical protein
VEEEVQLISMRGCMVVKLAVTHEAVHRVLGSRDSHFDRTNLLDLGEVLKEVSSLEILP